MSRRPDTKEEDEPAVSPLDAARAAAAAHPDPVSGSLAAHLHAALAEVDRLQERLDSYGSPVRGRVPLPKDEDAWGRKRAFRRELESGFTTAPQLVGMALCPAGAECPSGLYALFHPTRRGRMPMHRSQYGNTPCPAVGQKATPLRLKEGNAQ